MQDWARLALAQLEAEGVRPPADVFLSAVAHVGGTLPPEPAPLEFADDPTPSQTGPPASSEVALAGRDGAALARIVRDAKARGVDVFNHAVRSALGRYDGRGSLLSREEISRIAESLATVNTTAELVGRARVRELADRVDALGDLSEFADGGQEPLAAVDTSVLSTPEEAASYFAGLYPFLSVDHVRMPTEQRRYAFTLAQSADRVITERVQGIIADAMRRNVAVSEAAGAIADALTASGATTKNPQYAEMIFRTNAMDAFQTGMYEEGRTNDLKGTFPSWEYLGIDDSRTGEDHRPKIGRLYPAHATFADVRGNRPYNCRCSLRWINRFELARLQSSGRRLETHW